MLLNLLHTWAVLFGLIAAFGFYEINNAKTNYRWNILIIWIIGLAVLLIMFIWK